MKITLDQVVAHSPLLKTFWFKPEHKVDFLAGQITELFIAHNNPDNRGERRWYTIASSPTEDLIAFTTKFTDQNGSTFKQALSALKTDDSITMTEPIGDFVLPIDQTMPLVFVAGGVGIAPVRAIIKYLIDKQEHRKIKLYYSVHDQQSLIFDDLLKKYPMEYHPFIGERINIAELTNQQPETLFYLSGPQKMVQDLTKQIIDAGIKKTQIILDYFPGY